MIDERFKLNALKIELVALNVTDLQRRLRQRIPEIDRDVFQTTVWRDKIQPLIDTVPMILSDFLRLSLLYLYGGSWIDADAVYIRPFTMKDAAPSYDRFERIDRPDCTLYCTNGIGQLEKRASVSAQSPFTNGIRLSRVQS